MNRLISVLLSLLFAVPALAADKVKIQLNWVPEPEFGGIFEAQRSGTFTKHGLDVEIATGGAGTPTWQLVATGRTRFAIASADEVIIAREHGADVVAIFATYQKNPQGLMAHAARGFKKIGDIFNHSGTLAVEPGLPYVAFLRKKFGFGKLQVVAYNGGVAGFLHDPNYVQQCFVTSEPIAARKAGSDPQFFSIAEAGYNPYTAVVITRSAYAKEHSQEIHNLFVALQEGWRSYLDNPKPADQVMEKLNPDMDAATFAAAAEAQKPFIETGQTETSGLGTMTRARWLTLGKQLVDLKVVKHAPPAEACFVNVGK